MKSFLAAFLLLMTINTAAQIATLNGFIGDSLSNEPLPEVSIYATQSLRTKSNASGTYSLNLPAGEYILRFSMVGYFEKKISVDLHSGEKLTMNTQLVPKNNSLNIVTISGSRFSKQIAEEIVSIEVVRPAQILNTANNSMDDALQRVPGVDVVENQVNIRGGSGWSYGAGSRVMVLVDDMPMLTADAGDAKWDFLPLENCEQVEILKGASSALYGSSALNGVINFRTAYAKSKPKTKAMLYNGMFGNPKNKDWKWWGKQQPAFQGGYLMHAQKFGQLDMVLGSAWFSEDSYLQGDLSRRARVNMNLRYRFKKVEGLTLGLNTNLQMNKSQTFFFWQPDSVNGTKYYQPFGGLSDSSTTINKNQGQRLNIDPSIQYLTKSGNKHVLRTRWFRSKNDIPEKKQSSTADTYFGEYQFLTSFKSRYFLLNDLKLVSGLMGSYSKVVGELYGSHKVSNIAPYAQLEKRFGKLWASLGARLEFNQLDSLKRENKPVFRVGCNYELTKATFLRASFGQGYRYPSIAERFVNTKFGASQVFPNVELQSETGWSSEIGIKQFYQLGSWKGFIDAAAFWTEYHNMMEFNFGLYLPKDSSIGQVNNPQDYLGFKSLNVGNARINGLDFSILGQGKIGVISSQIILGCTFMNPTAIHPDSAILANLSGDSKTLKYRYRQSIKFDMENTYQKISIGSTFLYNSFMKNIDEVFTNSKPEINPFGTIFQIGTGLPASISKFRKTYNKGTFIWDARIAYALTKQIRLAFIVRNLLNTVYAERPALIGPPRNFTLQLGVEL